MPITKTTRFPMPRVLVGDNCLFSAGCGSASVVFTAVLLIALVGACFTVQGPVNAYQRYSSHLQVSSDGWCRKPWEQEGGAVVLKPTQLFVSACT